MGYDQKTLGKVYTPASIIDVILDNGGYYGSKILKKHVIDNSAGNGEFLIKFMERYIKAFYKKHSVNSSKDNYKLISDLEKYIHGIEINESAIDEIKKKIILFSKENNLIKIPEIDLIVVSGDALKVDFFDNNMDFVFGNPPYVRRRNIDFLNYEMMKKYNLKGNIDLYILFFFKGLEMLKIGGTLGYITPNSFFTSSSGRELRVNLKQNYRLKKIINLGHENPFKNKASTYTAITILEKKQPLKKIDYKENFLEQYKKIALVENKDNNFYFDLSDYNKKILTSNIKIKIKVKNGAATCADWFFYNNDYKGKYIKKAYKASTEEEIKAFFPYDNNANLVSEEDIKKNNFYIYDILLANRIQLENRSLQNRQWYEYARSQGIKDFLKDDVYTLAVNNLIKKSVDLKLHIFEQEIIIFSGYYIQSKNIEELNDVAKWITTNDFFDYVKSLNKQKSGNYYSFSSKDLEQFINYKFYEKESKNELR